jgi:ABC-type transport system substrate-binding protein
VKRPEYSLSEAKELMEEAGYADGFTVKFPIVSLRENVGQFIKDSGKII